MQDKKKNARVISSLGLSFSHLLRSLLFSPHHVALVLVIIPLSSFLLLFSFPIAVIRNEVGTRSTSSTSVCLVLC